MKPFFVFLCVYALFVSCREKPATKNVPDKNYYLEFRNEGEPGVQDWTIKAVKRKLYGSRYAISMGEETMGADNSDKPEEFIVHHFHDISEYQESDKEAEKIVIIFRKRDKDGLYNFDFHSYRKNGSKEWQSVYDPGNFRYHDPHPEGQDKDLGVWMSDLIVELTFK